MDVMLEYVLIIIGACAGFGVFTKLNIDKHKHKKLSKKQMREAENKK